MTSLSLLPLPFGELLNLLCKFSFFIQKWGFFWWCLVWIFFFFPPQNIPKAINCYLAIWESRRQFFWLSMQEDKLAEWKYSSLLGNSHSQSALLLLKGLEPSENRKNESNPDLYLSPSIRAERTGCSLESCCGCFQKRGKKTSVCGSQGNWATCRVPFLLLPVTTFAPIQLTWFG